MAKKKVGTSNIVLLVAALLAVVAIFMMLAPGNHRNAQDRRKDLRFGL